MPFYNALKVFKAHENKNWQIEQYKDPQEKLDFIARRLIELKNGLRVIPHKTVSQTLLLATWNLREFDSNGKKNGPRLEESFYYIAEVINAFDIVALQEIREDLAPLKKVLKILGPSWDYFATDITVGLSGNNERMAFVYDKSKVFFTNVAGEIVLPEKKGATVKQFARTPYLVSFQAGWLKLNLCTVHIYYGSGKKVERRIKEIGDVSMFFKDRADKTKEDYVLLGDFNIVGRQDKTMKALLKGNFKIPPELANYAKGSNLDRSKYYDQIVYRDNLNRIQFTKNAGVFDYYQYVFRDKDMNVYKKEYNFLRRYNKKKSIPKMTPKIFREWKTFQMSDHLPLWVEFRIDFSYRYLNGLKKK